MTLRRGWYDISKIDVVVTEEHSGGSIANRSLRQRLQRWLGSRSQQELRTPHGAPNGSHEVRMVKSGFVEKEREDG